MPGYNPKFLGRRKTLKVPLPTLPHGLRQEIAPVKDSDNDVLHYPNYSLVQHAERRLPIYTACNIHGKLYRSIPRREIFPGGRDKWRKDRRISYKHQWGGELYSAPKSDFDKGHMVKREDVQWGDSKKEAVSGAQGTFYYTNAAPQHKDLNRAIWKDIEDYILHDETTHYDLKVNSFTGPVLTDEDPIFVSEVRNTTVRIPSLFWKVVYYTKDKRAPLRVSFLVGQLTLLESNEIVKPVFFDRSGDGDTFFLDFDHADTYQVKTDFIEQLTGLSFADADDPFQDDRPAKLILEEVNIPGAKSIGRKLSGLTL